MKTNCRHLPRRADPVLKHYTLLIGRIVFPIFSRDVKTKANRVRCPMCPGGDRLNALLCCCFECATFACLPHLRKHLAAKNHTFALLTTSGELFCGKCNDFVFQHRVEKIRSQGENAHRRRLALSLKAEWNPCREEVHLFRRTAPIVHRLGLYGTRGLRGLVNLGNSCFMNCIIQTLTHIPMLRDYFLTDQHKCRHQLLPDPNSCLMCEMSNLVQEFYSGNVMPFIPHRMLHMVWTHAQHLAGYEQHDAHEFFISALNILHKHADSTSLATNPHKCTCIIDRLFTGQLQSDLTCVRCGHLSTTVEPYWDISLQLNDCVSGRHAASKSATPNATGGRRSMSRSGDTVSAPSESLNGPSRNRHLADGASAAAIDTAKTFFTNGEDDAFSTASGARDSPASNASITPGLERTLQECLENYVKCERLDPTSKIRCDHCGSYEESIKQLTLRKLPMVICFHLKRFEHSSSRKTEKKRRKIRARVNFPEYIDLTPYTTSYRDACRQKEQEGELPESEPLLRQHPYPTRQQQQRKSSGSGLPLKMAPPPPPPLSPISRAGSACGGVSSPIKMSLSSPINSAPRRMSSIGGDTASISPPSLSMERYTSGATMATPLTSVPKYSQTAAGVTSMAPFSPISQPTKTMHHLARLSNRYVLMAVVNHNGTTDSGHYTCHIRHQHQNWYKCNDHIISREKVDQALDSEGYLLFYCKLFLDYD